MHVHMHAAAACAPQTLNEYIEDTEDLVNLKLDQHRNQVGTTRPIVAILSRLLRSLPALCWQWLPCWGVQCPAPVPNPHPTLPHSPL